MKAGFGLSAVLLAAVLLAPPRSAAAASDTSGATSLTFSVVVTDKADRPVAGLQASDFAVFDNKKPRAVSSARMASGEASDAAPPVEAFLLIDQINIPFETLSYERKNIENYLRQSGGHLLLPTSFIFLTETDLQFQGEPTRDANLLLKNLADNPPPQRSFQFQGGMQQGVEMRQKSLEALNGLALKLNSRPGRKLVIWISPGWPTFSHLTSQKSPREFDILFNYIVGISTMLRQADVTLYAVDPLGAQRDLSRDGNTTYQQFVKGVPSAKQADNGDLSLQVFAAQTGGKVLYGSNDLAKLVDQCLADAQVFYLLSVDEPAAAQANEFHSVEVRVNKPGLKARARTIYYMQP